jgi:hypothetical protein
MEIIGKNKILKFLGKYGVIERRRFMKWKGTK